MKRPIARVLIVAALAGLAACREPPVPESRSAPEANDWIMPPRIDAVVANGRDLTVRGLSAPLGRVAVSDPGGQAYAVAADNEGRFEVRIPRPERDTLFVVEARAGQLSYPGPYRLLVAADPRGPIGLLSIGAPSRRLSPGPSLDAVDSDGRAAFLSGRAAAGSVVAVDAGQAMRVVAAPDGRWSVAVTAAAVSAEVDGAVYTPPSGPAASEGRLDRASDGWRISWSGPDGARQTTWFPDRRMDGGGP